MNAFKKASKELQQELFKQIEIIYCAAAIVMYRYYGWRKKRITDLFSETDSAWDECASTNEKSMLQIVEDETGVEMTIPESDKSWHDLAYLNGSIHMDPKDMTAAQWTYMRIRQKRWVGAQVAGCVLLALHRKHGFGYDRIVGFLGKLDDVRNEYGWDRKRLKTACRTVIGINISDLSRMTNEMENC